MYFNHTDALKGILCPMRPGIQFQRALPETRSNLYRTGRPNYWNRRHFGTMEFEAGNNNNTVTVGQPSTTPVPNPAVCK